MGKLINTSKEIEKTYNSFLYNDYKETTKEQIALEEYNIISSEYNNIETKLINFTFKTKEVGSLGFTLLSISLCLFFLLILYNYTNYIGNINAFKIFVLNLFLCVMILPNILLLFFIYEKYGKYTNANKPMVDNVNNLFKKRTNSFIKNFKEIVKNYGKYSEISKYVKKYNKYELETKNGEELIVKTLKGLILNDNIDLTYATIILSILFDKTINGENTKKILSFLNKDELIKLIDILLKIEELDKEVLIKTPYNLNVDSLNSIQTIYSKIIPSILNTK